MDVNTESPTTTLIFLFTDLEGSTRLWQEYPEAMKTVLARHDEIIFTAVEDHNGEIVKTTGDGFHAAFRSAQDGLLACITAQQQILAEKWAIGEPLYVRMGLHMGEAQEAGARIYALKAATRLCELEMRTGQAVESGSLLADIYDSFTEGFMTADLLEVKAVLDQWQVQ